MELTGKPLAAPEMKHDFNQLFSEVMQLRNEISAIRQPAPAPLRGSTEESLIFHFEANGLERKPFTMRSEGSLCGVERLSRIRTALLLVLLLDLKERLEGGRGHCDLMSEMVQAYRSLDPEASNRNGTLPALIRTAVHRLHDFVSQSNCFRGKDFKLILDRQNLRLEIAIDPDCISVPQPRIEISSVAHSIHTIIDQSFAGSPLTNVRRRKASFLEPGEQGHDRFFYEVFNHDNKVEAYGNFERPSLQSLPEDLLMSAGVSELRVRQVQLLHEGFASGRCSFTEIHSIQNLEEMVRQREDGSFPIHPAHFSSSDVYRHVRNIVHLLKTYPSYQFYLTDAKFPFYLVSLRVFPDAVPDCYTVFIRRFSDESLFKVSSFVVHDVQLSESVNKQIISAALEHPSTITCRKKVICYLENLAERITGSSIDKTAPIAKRA